MRIAGLSAGVLALAGSLVAPGVSEASSLQIVFVSHSGDRHGAYQAGYERGLRDGLREGSHDGKHGDAFGSWDERRYSRCDYRASYGPRRDYQAGYRRGFESGYERGYAASFRCARHHRAGCEDPRCRRAYDRRYRHSDDDWAYRDEGGSRGRRGR